MTQFPKGVQNLTEMLEAGLRPTIIEAVGEFAAMMPDGRCIDLVNRGYVWSPDDKHFGDCWAATSSKVTSFVQELLVSVGVESTKKAPRKAAVDAELAKPKP